jgi:UPF0716 protein FxsA
VLLVLPGFFTDALGLLLLLPPVRHALVALAARRVVMPSGGPRYPDDVIDGEYSEVDTDRDRLRKPSGWTQD